MIQFQFCTFTLAHCKENEVNRFLFCQLKGLEDGWGQRPLIGIKIRRQKVIVLLTQQDKARFGMIRNWFCEFSFKICKRTEEHKWAGKKALYATFFERQIYFYILYSYNWWSTLDTVAQAHYPNCYPEFTTFLIEYINICWFYNWYCSFIAEIASWF